MKQIDHHPQKEHLGPFWPAIALILFGIIMAAWHWLLTGIDDNFGVGVVVGFVIGAGGVFLLSRSARNLR